MKVKSLLVLVYLYNDWQEVGLICSYHQSRVTVGLTHIIENRYDTLVLMVLASRRRNDTKAVQTHWLFSLHPPTHSVLASTVLQ